ncbi:hypothetical protein RRG08_029097 [Elysia crispata]|uniref:Uncharacterized protein n=1 Tax=Elysia crispata TaxID=231223 RepID=A0AAE0YSW0_9GAST|nr:hypothetical protein RRG08_029097 [Elysia crispata]
MEKIDIIKKSSSPWASPLHMVCKPNDGWRPCYDDKIKRCPAPDRCPVPHIHDFSSRLKGKTIFSKLDLVRGYHQTSVALEDIPKTAVITPFGLWEFLRMPFGLKSAAQTFQRLMNSVLQDIDSAFVYLDDILIASSTEKEHPDELKVVFRRLTDHGLVIRLEKCLFGVSYLEFLGHQVSKKGSSPTQAKVKVIQTFYQPSTMKGLQEFLGMINFYHSFLPNIAATLSPLYGALKSFKPRQELVWSQEMKQAFLNGKTALANAAMLVYPCTGCPLALTSDALDVAVGAVLEQFNKGRPRPIEPPDFRRAVFDVVHNLSHPGVKARVKLVSDKFVWYGMRKQVRKWVKEYHHCQSSKIQNHTKAPLEHLSVPQKRFSQTNIDIVGPLPFSSGFTYLLTIIDRNTRWPEAIPLRGITTPKCVHALITVWFARFGVPGDISSDRRSQFTSSLWS